MTTAFYPPVPDGSGGAAALSRFAFPTVVGPGLAQASGQRGPTL